MWEANLIFKSEDREGLVPVGTYLADAAGRLGLRPEKRCVPFENIHFCRLAVVEGHELLSEKTSHEKEFLIDEAASDFRLGCQTKIEEPGEIIVMTDKKKKEAEKTEEPEKTEDYSKEFTELPLEKKIAQLAQLEAIALSETVSFVINSPYLIFDKVMDVMAEFGLKKGRSG